jgi:hypothetical protein
MLENPKSSRLFLLPPVQRLLQNEKIQKVDVDMCSFGLCDPVSKLYYKKATRIIGSLPKLESLGLRCNGEHQHQHVEDSVFVEGHSVKRSVLAGRYPERFCVSVAKLVRSAVDLSARSRLERRAAQDLPR